jgi:hypothetical protein
LRSIPKVKITLDKNYDASQKVDLKVNISPLSASNGDFRLHACITEDKIIDSQEDNIIYVKIMNTIMCLERC